MERSTNKKKQKIRGAGRCVSYMVPYTVRTRQRASGADDDHPIRARHEPQHHAVNVVLVLVLVMVMVVLEGRARGVGLSGCWALLGKHGRTNGRGAVLRRGGQGNLGVGSVIRGDMRCSPAGTLIPPSASLPGSSHVMDGNACGAWQSSAQPRDGTNIRQARWGEAT